MAGSYGYITLGQLRAALMQRLQDVGNVATPVVEANFYITESLRVLNAQTWAWNSDYRLDFNPGDSWKSLNVPGSPRQRTVTDAYLYSQMEAMLYEPMSGGIWTGTSQFNITLLSQALQYRRDELLLLCTANVVRQLMPSPTLGVRTFLSDSTLDLLRVRWIPVDSGMGFLPYALGRGDVNSRNGYGVLLPIQPGEPDSWLITANPPLSFDCSCPPNQPGTWDLLMQFAGLPLAPPSSTLVGIPDDWTPALIYGALADVLSNAPEGRDSARAKYCLSRYEQFKKAIIKMPWLVQATIESVPCDTPSYVEMDTWAQNWEQTWDPTDPQIVVGGIDLVALGPFATSTAVSSVLTLIGNAPIPANDAARVQLDRAGVDAILNYAQHLASFKFGGADFAATFPLFELFEEYCRTKNRQYAALGIYRPEMLLEGSRAELIDPRFEGEGDVGKKTR